MDQLTPRLTSERAGLNIALAIAVAAGLVRLAMAVATPLFPDETYYWEWSRRLAVGYFDHPPMIAWLIRAGTLVAGDTSLGVRLVPVLAGTASAIFLILAARRVGGDRAAIVTALAFAAMPLSSAGLILATPDAALFAATSGMVYAIVRALEFSRGSLGSLAWWSVAGIALGIGLLSKYTAVLIPMGVAIALAVNRDFRGRLAEPGPYIAILVGLALFSPVVWWNATHEWASFAFQLRHGLAGGGSLISALNREVELIGGQMGLVTPILFVMLVMAVARAFGRGSLLSDAGVAEPAPAAAAPAADAVRRVFAVTTLFVFLFFVYSASRRRAEANWPALAYVPGILVLASHVGSRRWNRWFGAGLILAGIVSLIVYVNSLTPILPVPARRDPVARSAGWNELATVVQRYYEARQRISPRPAHIAADRYQEASQLAYHLPGNPAVFALNLTSRPNQYDYWPRFTDRARLGDVLILVVDERLDDPPTVKLLSQHFYRVAMGEPVVLAREGDPVKHLRLWIMDGWIGTWPGTQLRSAP